MFTIYSDSSSDSTMVSNLFIDEYMKGANDAQIKVYLYLLRVMGAHRSTSVSELADQFNHTEKDVVRSLRYWEKKGLLDLTFDRQEDLVSICLRRPERAQERHVLSFMPPADRIPLDPQQKASGADTQYILRPAAGGNFTLVESAPPAQELPQVQEPPRVRTSSPVSGDGQSGQTGTAAQDAGIPVSLAGRAASSSEAPVPSARESDRGPSTARKKTVSASAEEPTEMEALEKFRADPDRVRLLFVIEQYIGKPLSLNELRIIFHISEKLHFSDELLDHLLQYCVDRGKKDFRYIRKVAENWADQGIMTPAQAEAAAAAESRERPRAGRKGASKTSADSVHGGNGEAAGRQDPSEGGTGSGSSSAAGNERNGTAARRPRTANSFNQFEQNSYDFDALEEELLQS